MDRRRTGISTYEAADHRILAWTCASIVIFLIAALLAGWSWTAVPERSLMHLGGSLLLIPVAAAMISRVPHAFSRGILRLLGVVALSSVLFAEMEHIQLVMVHRWFDDALLAVEPRLIGGSLVLQLQIVAKTPVIEGLMFAYVGYGALLIAAGFLCHYGAGYDALHQYILHLALTFSACYIGFLLFPVAGPVFHAPATYPEPLTGGLFTYLGEWIRANQHFPGGSLPSPHCAATTVMVLMLRRHHRTAFYILLPMLLSVYAATVIGRYHYIWDGIAGIGAAVAMLAVADRLRGFVRVRQRGHATADGEETAPSMSTIAPEGF